jgi:TetR/AcrR family transcriptional repressor of nem operon
MLTEITELPETKRKLVDAGVKLMRVKGYNATSVDEICSDAGVTKGGFFHYFKSKEDLAQTAMSDFREKRLLDMANAPFRKLADPLDRIFARLDYVKSSQEGLSPSARGCLVGMFAQELASTNPEFRRACLDSFRQSAKDFEKDLTEAKALYAPKAEFDPEKLASLYVSLYQGSKMISKTLDSHQILSDNLDQFRLCLEALFGRMGKGGKSAGKSRG